MFELIPWNSPDRGLGSKQLNQAALQSGSGSKARPPEVLTGGGGGIDIWTANVR